MRHTPSATVACHAVSPVSRAARLALAFATLLAVLAVGSVAEAATVSGTVTCNGAVQVAATIQVVRTSDQSTAAETSTNGSGVYSVVLSPDTYGMLVTPPAGSACVPESVTGVVVTGDKTFDIILVPPTGGNAQISGVVTGLDGRPLPGAMVRFFGNSGSLDPATADENGFYSASVLAGTYTVRVDSNGSTPDAPSYYRCWTYDVAVNAPTVVNFAVPVIRVSGTVTGGTSGVPLPNVQVSVASNQGGSPYCEFDSGTITTDADGRYASLALANGNTTYFSLHPQDINSPGAGSSTRTATFS
ncbi:MAG: carboxypeptidase regulatory-like domain-containing protein [Myxococcales bacterium]|nr:carboxypeptidase regulatory-like domain-containing protein [Myxococcales bacterium]MCB9737171.1 carboxypeptidase regulatory-like domain-containing protein [Deltaproteobacteria bacterium]